MSFNLATMLTQSAATYAEKPMLHVGDRSFTYAEVDDLSGRVASSLEALGLTRGDKVAVQLPNVPQFVFAYFGILKAGMTMVPINPLLTAPEVSYHLQDSDARLLISYEAMAPAAINGAREAGGVPVYLVGTDGPSAVDEARDFEELLKASNTGIQRAMSSDDTAVLLYTSGTTGRPKGAELTHFQLYMNCTVAGELFGVRSDDVSLGVLPLFHVFGLSSVLNIVVRHGATLVLVPRFDAASALDAIERHKVTIFSGVPTMFIALVQADVAGRDTSSLRAACSGGASMPGEVIRAFEEKFDGVVVLEGYGLSESASTATFNISAEERKVLSVGKPIWGVEFKILGENGEVTETGPDARGEIAIRGHNIMKGYYKRPDATAEVMQDGWFRTGDIGYRDEDGFYFIVDRLKDLIIRGGYNVYPREVEEILYEHADVVEAAVIGRPDERLGEEVVAFVVLRPNSTADEAELTAHCKERLAAYKYPRSIIIRDELPKGPSGKILKRELRA
ncbi:long-chain-fatty-acid--CoA ligase [Nocardioides ultimimeridianus]